MVSSPTIYGKNCIGHYMQFYEGYRFLEVEKYV